MSPPGAGRAASPGQATGRRTNSISEETRSDHRAAPPPPQGGLRALASPKKPSPLIDAAAEVVMSELRREGVLYLDRGDRDRWERLGLTLAMRDRAAETLVERNVACFEATDIGLRLRLRRGGGS